MKQCLLVLDIGGTFLKACLCGRDGVPLPDSFDQERVNSDGDLQEIKNAYQSLLKRLHASAAGRDLQIAAVAADIPGPFDFAAGISNMRHKYTSLFGVPLIPWFQEVLGDIPVRFLHDSSAFLTGAALAHPEVGNAAGVMIGTGLGFSVMQNGTVLQNERGGPAYSIYNAPYLGKTAEDYVSARAICRRYTELSSRPTGSAKYVADLAESANNPAAVQVYRELGKHLAAIISPLLTQLGTQALYLGGQISKSFRLFEPSLRSGLSGVSTLRVIEAASAVDLVHLVGTAHWLLQNNPSVFSEGV